MVFFSTFLYAQIKAAGPAWKDVLARELALGPRSGIPALRTWAATSNVDDVALSVSGPSLLAMGRSQVAQTFLDTRGADVWVSCDDDVYASDSVLRRLVGACRTTGGMVTAPTLQRNALRAKGDPGICNVRFPPRPPEVTEGEGFTLAAARSTGFGLVALHRTAIATMVDGYPDLWVESEDTGKSFAALFFERIEAKRWQGEDMAFCHRVREMGLPMHALMHADVEYAVRRMLLELDEGGELAMRIFDLAG